MSDVRTWLPSPSAELGTTFYQEDCVGGLRCLVPPGSLDVVFTSPPYNLGIDYRTYDDRGERGRYLEWMDSWCQVVKAALAERGSIFVNVGGSPKDPHVPFELYEVFRRHFRVQNVFHWVKSVALDVLANGSYARRKSPRKEWELITEVPQFGHYKPINSPRFVNDCAEFVFHLTHTGDVELDRCAVGVPFADKCLAQSTEVVALVDNVLTLLTLGSLRDRFLSGAECQLPSYDFEAQVPVWTSVKGFTEPQRQETRTLTLRSGAQVIASKNHRFPVLTRNTRAQEDAMRNLTLEEIEQRQERWTSRPISLYGIQDLSDLVPERPSRLYNYDTGYVVGLWLAEGYRQGDTALRWAACVDEDKDPEFGGFLDRYFEEYFHTTVKRYPGSSEGGIQFYVSNATFRALVEEHVSGDDARTKDLKLNRCLKHGRVFLQGIVDGYLKGDGHFVRSHTYYTVGMGENQRLLETLRTVCLMIGYEFKQIRDSFTHLECGSYRRKNFRIRKSVFTGRKQPRSNGLSAERVETINGGPVNQFGEMPTLDVEVEIEHHMFFLANGMLTHNSNVTRGTRGKNGDVHCRGNVVFIPYKTIQSRKKGRGGHPATFPVELAEYFFRLHGLSRIRQVCDPFLGVGHTALAARRLGLAGTYFEIDADYLATAIECFRKTASPPL